MSAQSFKEEIINFAMKYEDIVEIDRTLFIINIGGVSVQGKSAEKMLNDIDAVMARTGVSEREAAIYVSKNYY